MSGTILRRRDRTARPPRVEHYSSAVNTRQHAMPAMAAAGADEAVRPAQPDQRRAALLLGTEGLPKRLVTQTTHGTY